MQMPEVLETGRPILLDIWTISERSFRFAGAAQGRARRGDWRAGLLCCMKAANTSSRCWLNSPACKSQLECTAKRAAAARAANHPGRWWAIQRHAVAQARRSPRRPSGTAPCCCWVKPAPAKSCWARHPRIRIRPHWQAVCRHQCRRHSDSLLEAELFGAAAAFTPAPTARAVWANPAGRRRHAVSGRNRRYAAEPVSQAAARCCKKKSSRWAAIGVPGGLAGDCRHQRRPAAPGGRRQFRADLLSAECAAAHPAAAAPATGRPCPACANSSWPGWRKNRLAAARHRRRRTGAAA